MKTLRFFLTPFILTSLLLIAGCGENTGNNTENVEIISEDISHDEEAFAVDRLDRSDEGYVLVWNDEFDGDSLDTSKWCLMHGNGSDYGIENWGNNELQSYEYDNVTVEDGKLVITARKEDKNNKQFTSGRLRTLTDDNEELFTVKYGRIEAKLKVIGNDGIWPAFWMLPADTGIYGGWAASGELDIFEAKGRLPQTFCGTAHYGGTWPNNVYSSKEYYFDAKTSIRDYHTYALEWTPKELKWYVDDECYSTLTNWYAYETKNSVNYTAPAPFDVPFYLILNLAVGGSFDAQGAVSNDSFPAAMYVDFVRVYQLTEGYDDTNVKAAYNTGVKKETGHQLYNKNFDEGTNRLAFWNAENCEAIVPSFVLDKDGKENYSRAVQITANASEGRLYQTGLLFEASSNYGVKFDVQADTDLPIRVEITDGEGNVIVTQSTTVPGSDTKYSLKFTFLNESEENIEDGIINFYVGEGGTMSLDNLLLQKID